MKLNFEDIVNTAPVLLWMTDQDEKCSFLSPQWRAFIGTGSNQQTNKKPDEVWRSAVHPDDLQKVRQNFLQSSEKRHAFSTEYRLRKKDGEYHWMLESATPYYDDKQSFLGYVGSVTDIQEQRTLSDNQTRASESSKILIKDELLGIVSHELKTPLTSIKGYVQILERIIEEMGNDRAQKLLTKTNTYINRLNSLITDLLDVSKIQSGKLQFNIGQLDIHALLEESVSALQPTTDHRLIIQENTHTFVEGDAHRLEQVMSNLITNAIKYSPKADKVFIRALREAEQVIISVEDFGIGIDQQYMNKLFHRFYRVEASAQEFSGLGIGLFISSEIITRHGGKIWLESELGKGSTFYFSLPLKTSLDALGPAAIRPHSS